MNDADREDLEQLVHRYIDLRIEGVEGAAEEVLERAGGEARRAALKRWIERDQRILAALPARPMAARFLAGYRILEELERGPEGTLYRAEQPSLGRDVLVRLLPPDLVLERRERLVAEYRILARLRDPSIAAALEWLETSAGICLVTIYQRIPTLAALIRHARAAHRQLEDLLRGGAGAEAGRRERPGVLLARIFERLARALSAAHRAGVTHGNLSARNILIDEDGFPYLVGFGFRAGSAGDPGGDHRALRALLHECLRVSGQRRARIPAALWGILEPRRRGSERGPGEGDAERSPAGERGLAEELGRFLRGELPRARPRRLGDRLRLRAEHLWRTRRALLFAAAALLAAPVGAWLLFPASALSRGRQALAGGEFEEARRLFLVAVRGSRPAELTPLEGERIVARARALLARGEAGPTRQWVEILRAMGGAPAGVLRELDALARGHWLLEIPAGVAQVELIRSDEMGRRLGSRGWGSSFELEQGYWMAWYRRGSGPHRCWRLLRLGSGLDTVGRSVVLGPAWTFDDRAAPGAERFPAGRFIRGHSLRSDAPSRRPIDQSLAFTSVPAGEIPEAFELERCEVSRARYRRFIQVLEGRYGGHGPFCHPDEPDRPHQRIQGAGDPRLPAVGLCFWDAWAFACWAHARLPTEEEYERAIRGTDGRSYYWGDQPKPLTAGRIEGVDDLAPVDEDPLCAGPLLHLHDNAWEFTSSLLTTYPGQRREARLLHSRRDVILRAFSIGGTTVENAARADLRGVLLPGWFREPVGRDEYVNWGGCRLARTLVAR